MSMQPNDGNTPREDRALQGKMLANAKLEQMRHRADRIRRTIALSTAGLFAAAFLGVSVQLASGHDPALLAAAKRSSTLKASTGSEESSNGFVESEESSPSPVTTSQS